jgi:hypothetical protein
MEDNHQRNETGLFSIWRKSVTCNSNLTVRRQRVRRRSKKHPVSDLLNYVAGTLSAYEVAQWPKHRISRIKCSKNRWPQDGVVRNFVIFWAHTCAYVMHFNPNCRISSRTPGGPCASLVLAPVSNGSLLHDSHLRISTRLEGEWTQQFYENTVSRPDFFFPLLRFRTSSKTSSICVSEKSLYGWALNYRHYVWKDLLTWIDVVLFICRC